MKILKTSTVWILAILLFSFQGQRSHDGFQISGKVIDAISGTPIKGVNVVLKGSIVGTTTDQNGEYSMAVASNRSILIFSYLSYQTLEIEVGKQRRINVGLKSSASEIALREVEELIFEEAMEMTLSPSMQPKSARTMGSGAQYSMSKGAAMRSDNTANYDTEEYDFIQESGFNEATKIPYRHSPSTWTQLPTAI